MSKPLLFAGSSHPKLAEEICCLLETQPGKISLSQFPDGEIAVHIQENVQGCDVLVLQSLALHPNYYLMELLLMVDALKRASAKSITAIIPYLGYCRQDRKDKPGAAISAKLVANLLTTAGVNHLITCDLHADQVEGFFEIPITHLHCQSLFCEAIEPLLTEDCVIVAPDIGSIKMAERLAKVLGLEIAVIKKQRLSAFKVEMSLIGEVKHKNVLLIDDLCSTAGTLTAAANLCQELGAKKIVAAISHGLFVGEALKKLENSALSQVLITNTIPASRALSSSKIKVLSIASLLIRLLPKLALSEKSADF